MIMASGMGSRFILLGRCVMIEEQKSHYGTSSFGSTEYFNIYLEGNPNGYGDGYGDGHSGGGGEGCDGNEGGGYAYDPGWGCGCGYGYGNGRGGKSCGYSFAWSLIND